MSGADFSQMRKLVSQTVEAIVDLPRSKPSNQQASFQTDRRADYSPPPGFRIANYAMYPTEQNMQTSHAPCVSYRSYSHGHTTLVVCKHIQQVRPARNIIQHGEQKSVADEADHRWRGDANRLSGNWVVPPILTLHFLLTFSALFFPPRPTPICSGRDVESGLINSHASTATTRKAVESKRHSDSKPCGYRRHQTVLFAMEINQPACSSGSK